LETCLRECSTPLGVTDFCGLPGGDRRQDRRSAQRLSASLTSAVNRPYARGPAMYGCSTPLGVTDFCGLTTGQWYHIVCTCSTPLGVTDFCGGEIAAFGAGGFRVLNASRRH